LTQTPIQAGEKGREGVTRETERKTEKSTIPFTTVCIAKANIFNLYHFHLIS